MWDTLIEMISKLRDYPKFEVMENGRYQKRLSDIYERATDRMRIDKSDFDLLAKTFIFLSDKDIGQDMIDYMNECKSLGYKCVTSAEGEKIILEAEAIVKQRKHDALIKQMRDEKQKEFEEKKKAYDEYMASQNNIVDGFEKARDELEEFEQKVKELNSTAESDTNEVEDVEAKETDNEKVG